MNPCPDDGRLRAAIDGEDASTAHHVADCAHCTDRVAVMRRNADFAARTVATLSRPATDADLAAPGEGRSWRPAPRFAGVPAHRRGGTDWRRVAAGVAAVLVLGAAMATQAGQTAFADVLSVFRAERFQVVALDPATLRSDLAVLAELGELRGQPTDPVTVDGLDEAAEIAGFMPATLSQPPPGAPQVVAAAPQTVEVAFSTARTPDLPAELDGAVLRLRLPGVVVQQWGDAPSLDGSGAHAAGAPAVGAPSASGGTVAVVEAGQVAVDVAGGDLADLRRWLLDQPKLSGSLVAQLEAIDDWRTTLPIPLPVGDVAWRDVTVGGADGLAFGDDSGLAAAVVWPSDGRIRGVGGMVTATDAQALAEDLQSSR